jgi:peptide/nickel transport system ATP-binding protein
MDLDLLDVEHLHVDFETRLGKVQAVNDVSFQIKKGETFGLIGESGSGKSVIGMSLLRLLPKNASVGGTAFFQGIDLLTIGEEKLQTLRGDLISFIPQNPTASLNPLMKNGLQISEVFMKKGWSKQRSWKAALSVMERLLIMDSIGVSKKYPHQLSGGMIQRLVAGISMSLEPMMVIADEPTKGLDSLSRKKTIEFFRELEGDEDRSMMLITHDLDMAYEICDRLAVLYAGEIVEMGPAKSLMDDPEHPYTQGLLRSLPKNGLIPLEGGSPSLLSLPAGCFFQERCCSQRSECSCGHPNLIMNGGWLKRCHLP